MYFSSSQSQHCKQVTALHPAHCWQQYAQNEFPHLPQTTQQASHKFADFPSWHQRRITAPCGESQMSHSAAIKPKKKLGTPPRVKTPPPLGMAASTLHTVLVGCVRSGAGWSVIREWRSPGRLVYGHTIVGCPPQDGACTPIGLKKWIRDNGLKTFADNPTIVYGIYIHEIMAPGEWCQMFWYCQDAAQAQRVREKLRATPNDIAGIHMIGRTLNSLSKPEYETLKRKWIDM